MAPSPSLAITMLSYSSRNRSAPCKRCKASQHFAAGLPAMSLSHLAFLLESWSSVRKVTYSCSHFTDPTKSSDQMRPLLFAPSTCPSLAHHHYPRAAPYGTGKDIQSCSLWSRHIASDSTASLGAYLLHCVLRQCRDFPGTSEARDQER
jgi:hypothetical protein